MTASASNQAAQSSFAPRNISNAPEPQLPRSQIDERIVSLAQQSSDLNNAMTALEQRLQPILIPVPGAQGTGKDGPRPQECPLAEALLQIQGGNEGCITRLRDILSRIAL